MPDPTPALTTLSEEEELFRRTVRDFAERAVRPRVAAMERAAALDRALLTQCFELGLMGIEIPEVHGGAGVSDDFPLATMYAHLRTLRLADGPDEIHKRTIAREELRRLAPADVSPAGDTAPVTAGST